MRRLIILDFVSFVVACNMTMPATDANAAPSPTCTVSATTIAFGSVNVLAGAAVDTTSTITVTCSGGAGTGQRLCISIGAGSAGDATSRQLVGPGAATLRYDLYTDSARTVLWGSWQTGYDTAGVQLDVAQNSTTPVTVYARLFGSQQTAATGFYSSTFTTDPFVQYGNKGATACPTGNLNTSTSTSASATVVSSCNVGATTLNFGSQGVLNSNVDASSSVTATCTSGTAYNIGLNAGTGPGATVTTRKMTSGGATINYSLYGNSARTTNWGTTVGIDTVSGTGSGLGQSYTVYGRVPSQTTPAPATYSDTIVSTVTY
jgi:spore coat protein U-like protein